MNQARKQQRGFTIIELLLAMGFISMLLLAIVITGVQAGRMYNKGTVLQSVNQAGRDISDMVRRDFLQSDARLVSGAGTNPVIILQDGGHARSGRFCLGGYSYLWNIPNNAAGAPSAAIVRDARNDPISFVRVVDEGGSLCQESGGVYMSRLLDDSKVTHLLGRHAAGGGRMGLALYSLSVTPVTSTTERSEALYRIQYTVGTDEIREINTGNQLCKPPNDSEANDEFCAINQFEMIARTNG